jgi:hypothetical protein
MSDEQEAELDRLQEVVTRWGKVLIAEGHISINDFRAALYGPGPVREVRSAPSLDELEHLAAPYRRPLPDHLPSLDELTGRS